MASIKRERESTPEPETGFLLTVNGEAVAKPFLNYPVIQVRVAGESARSFFVHQDLLTSHSQYFKERLMGQSATGDNRPIISTRNNYGFPAVTIDDIDANAFETYVRLLYSGPGKISVQAKFKPPAPVKGESLKEREKALDSAIEATAQIEYRALSEQYLLCEKLRDLETKKKVLHAIIEATQRTWVDSSTRWPDEKTVENMYAGTLTNDPMRLFLAESYAIIGYVEWVKDCSAADFPREFLFDVLKAMLKYREIPKEYFQLQSASYYCEKLQLQATDERGE